jgi:PAS domain S-box-containing protein
LDVPEDAEKNDRPGRLSKIEPEVGYILDALPFGAFLVDADRQILAVNEALKRECGIDGSELIGAYCPILVHQKDDPVAECPLEEALETGKSAEKEIFDNGNARWIHASAYPTSLVTAGGKSVYLHFVRDITEVKSTAARLSNSLEHHRALCNLLQDLQHCRNCRQIMETLIDQVISLSWLGMASTAVGFLSDGNDLEMIVHRNVAPALKERCRRLHLGECLCGKAAEKGRTTICPSKSDDHDIEYEGMMEHQHVVLPIKHKDQTLGVLTLYMNAGDDQIDDFRIGFLEAAAAAAGAALDAQLAREEVVRTQGKYIAQAISSREDERKRVAYDLHDQLGQSLSAILLEMQSNAFRGAGDKSVQHSLETRMRELIDQVRQLAGQLRPAILDDYGLESALTRKIKEISGLRGIAIDYQSTPSVGKKERLPAAVEVSLYRVALEAIDNAVSHSAASHISVVLLWQEEKVTLLVEDDGRGFDYRAVRKNMDHCTGLIEMEERMHVLGGTLHIESASEKGTTVRAEVPAESIH